MAEVRDGPRLSMPWALAISIGVSVLTAGIAWGVLETRVDNVERDVETVTRDHRETAALVRGRPGERHAAHHRDSQKLTWRLAVRFRATSGS